MWVMGESLNQWITKKLKEKGWRQSELARQAGLDPSFISNVLSGKREPGAKFYLGMAKAFDIPITAIERLDKYGVEPDDLEADISLSEMIEISRQMTPQQRREALKYLLYLLRTGGADDEPDDLE